MICHYITRREEIVRKDVNYLISSWEQLNAGGGGDEMELQVPTGGKEKGRQSKEFRYFCGKFDEKEGSGIETDVRRKPGSDPSLLL